MRKRGGQVWECALAGNFAKDYQADPGNNEAVYNNWALGFMSGLNVGFEALDKPKRNFAMNVSQIYDGDGDPCRNENRGGSRQLRRLKE